MREKHPDGESACGYCLAGKFDVEKQTGYLLKTNMKEKLLKYIKVLLFELLKRSNEINSLLRDIL